jgi:hypothetical protein
MRRQVALLIVLAGPALADPVPAPVISPPDTWVPKQSGTLRVLNKLESTVQTVTLRVGQSQTLQSLSITLQACEVRPPDLPQDSTAHLAVTNSQNDDAGFNGWILQNEPAANMLQDPVYDIQLAGCT